MTRACAGCSHPTICRTLGCAATEYRRNKAAADQPAGDTMNTTRIRVTPASIPPLEGTSRQVARDYAQRAITPLAMAIAREAPVAERPFAVCEFFSVLIAQTALDARLAIGTNLAVKILTTTLAQLQRLQHEAPPWNDGTGTPP